MSGQGASKKVIVQRGLWFEEFETGVLYQHRPGRTITEADNVLFTHVGRNQHGDTVATASRKTMVRKHPEEEM